jgi:DNA (cytosine-5)-methyltransferase 1
MRFTCIDAFSGAGGLSLGLTQAGFSVLLSFDNDKVCVETQKNNPRYFTHPVICASIKTLLNGVLMRQLRMKPRELDLLAGGPPCQGFSIQRIGNDHDRRNDLILQYVQLISEAMPKYFVLENVKGLSGHRGQAYLDEVLQRTTALGYYPHMKILDAQDFGVPQRRQRVIVIGERLNAGEKPTFVFPAPSTPTGKRITVRSTIGELPPPPSDGTDHPEWLHHRRDRLSALNLKRMALLKQGQGRDYLPAHLLAECHKISSAVIGHRNVYGRMSWDEVAPTITARFDSFTRGLFGHPEQNRSISLREGAKLQTFPDNMSFAGSKVEIARQIGNAVPPNLAKSLGTALIKALREKKGGSKT